ncbi:TonB-dependent receptor [Ideonella sp. DXS22W]|uniref:TonB-dependent receptor n=1 Tax=Pseudaquabacterium inlustre TaxID=2984192 RepID=A0ABU9CEH1_9BURK
MSDLKSFFLRPARHWLGGLALACASTGHAGAQDLTDLSLERLLDTEVISAARFARQVTDAASAVSVMTAQDIRALGLRTLGEVLDQMRGLHVSHDLRYAFLGARGIGGPGSLAGRVMLLIDGQPAVDNLYDQLYLAQDSLIDPALIERIEYAPGGGSAMYGHNAFLGVINVLTRRGRELNGWEATASAGTNAERRVRLSGGRRLDNGAEWLASLTVRHDDGLPSAELGHQPWPGDGRAMQWLLKGQWQGWTAQALGMRHSAATRYGPVEDDRFVDGSSFYAIGHDRMLGEDWRVGLRWQGGQHYYHYDYDNEDGPRRRVRVDGGWWELDGQAAYQGPGRHALVLGLRWRQDPLLRYRRLATPTREAASWYLHRQSASASAEDRIRLRDDLHLTLGLRLAHRNGGDWTASPRNALVWDAAPHWTVKWSQGLSHRLPSVDEEDFGDAPRSSAEQVHSRELGVEYRGPQQRWLATAYHYRVRDLIGAAEDVQRLRGRGLEVEGEWQHAGWRLRGSQAWQFASDDLGRTLADSPRHLTKLQLSAPLGSERWRLSAALRHTGSTQNGSGGTVPASTRLDLTLLATRWLHGLDLRVGLRNLTNSRAHGQDDSFSDDPAWQGRRNRHAWIELGGSFQ